MKKNFVKKLALGLALVMTVTSVPVSSEAAAKPAFKTASVEVKEGETVKAVVKGTKGYKVKKVASKNEEVAKVVKFAQKAKKTNVKVTGVKAGETKVVAKLVKGGKVVKAKLNVTVVAEVAELKAVQTGSKQVTLTSNKDLTGATIAVKKGNNTVTSKAEISGTSAVLTLGANIVADTYTVTTGEETTTFVGEASKVTTIEMGDIAVVEAGVLLPVQEKDKDKTATVAYRVLSQFGEDLTAVTSVTANGSLGTGTVSLADGLATYKLLAGMREGDPVSVVIYDTTGVSASKTVKLSAASVVNSIEFNGIYNVKGDKLTEGKVKGDTFYMLVEAVDQYGNVIKDEKVLKENLTLQVASITGIQFGELTDITINDETKFAFPVKAGEIKAGSVTALLIANTGKNVQATFEVVDGIKVDTFTVAPSDMVVAGEESVFEYTAIDTYGNVIEHPKEEMFSENGFPKAFKFEKNAVTGKTELIYDAKDKEYAMDTPAVANFTTATFKPVTLTFTVKATAYPVAITGTEDFTPGMVLDETLANTENSLENKDVVFEDNYGRKMSYEKAIKKINGKTYSVKVDKFDEVTGLSVTTGAAANVATVTSTSATTAASITLKLNLIVSEAGKEDAIKSTYKVKFATKDINDLSDFTVTNKDTKVDISEGLINGNFKKQYATQITVTGIASDGLTVTVPAKFYSVYGALVGYDKDGKVADDGALHAANLYKEDDAVTEKEAALTVTIKNNAGTALKKTVKVSNLAPYAAKASVAYDYVINDNTLVPTTSGTVTYDELNAFVAVKDQYGNAYTGEKARITVTNVSEDVKVTNNGTQATEVKVKAGELVEVTYEYMSGVAFSTIIKVGAVK